MKGPPLPSVNALVLYYTVTAARALSPKLHISYLDLCCLDTRTLPLSSLGITLCI